MNNSRSLIVRGTILATMLFVGTLAEAAQVTLNLATASGTTNRLPIKIAVPWLSDQTKTTSLSGDISANLDFVIDTTTHQLTSNGITGISFNYQNPGHIAMSDISYSWLFGAQTAKMEGLRGTPYTPGTSGAVTKVDATTFNFSAANHRLEINQGIISWSGIESGSQDCTAAPISGLDLESTSTLTFNRTADSLLSSTFAVGLTMPVNFERAITSDVTMSTSNGNLVASGTYTQTYSNVSAYWDTATNGGLQAGNGTWGTSSAVWSTGTSGSNPLYNWVADGSTINAYFQMSGTSTVTVSGNVAVKSMNLIGTGYSFTGGTITVGTGGIYVPQAAAIGSAVTLGATQTWNVLPSKTLAVGGNITAGSNILTVKGAGMTSVSGTNSLNTLRVADSNGAGNLTVAGGTTTIGGDLVLGHGSSVGIGTMYLNAGTVTMNGTGRNFQVGGSGGSANATVTGRFTQTGGVFNFNVAAGTGGINLGNYGAAQFTVSGGTFNAPGNPLTVGLREPATLTISGAATQVALQSLKFNTPSSAVGNLGHGTVNLDGGTLTVGSVARNAASTATATFNFNGGTLRATASNSSFLTGLTNANIKEGGAKIDTQNFNVTIGQSLQHGGVAATDGGLTKSGGGLLTLAGTIAYTGPTFIDSGTLLIDNHQTTTLHALSGAGNLSIGSTSTLYATSINVNTLSIGLMGSAAAVPEPASIAMLALAGLFGGFLLRRFRR